MERMESLVEKRCKVSTPSTLTHQTKQRVQNDQGMWHSFFINLWHIRTMKKDILLDCLHWGGGTILQTLKNVLVNLIYMAMGLYYAIRLLMEFFPPWLKLHHNIESFLNTHFWRVKF